MRLAIPALALFVVACDPADPAFEAPPSTIQPWADEVPFEAYPPAGESGQLAPPTQSLTLTVSELVPGNTVTFQVTGLNPNERTYLGVGWQGFGDGPCFTGGLCVDLAGSPVGLATGLANASGVATMNVVLPAHIPPGNHYGFQVVSFRGNNSTKSNAVWGTVVHGGPGLSARPANPTCLAPDRPPTTASLTTVNAYPNLSGLSAPVVMVHPPGDDSVWYVGEQGGRIKRFTNSPTVTSASTALNISSQVVWSGELGFLSMAFHPDWPSTPEIYTYYTTGTTSNATSRISRFTSSNNGVSFGNEEVLLQVAQPFSNHNGGTLAFSPIDGYLYLGFGDGGSANDPLNSGSNTNTLLGAFIRIDVNGASPYTIPPDNPFANGVGGAPEVWAWGVRNPFRWHFDPITGALFAGDVGQDAREEISIIEGGKNYGWDVMEGTFCANPRSGVPACGSSAYTPPIYEYAHTGFSSRSVVGGPVYRGSAIPAMYGKALYAEFYTGQIFALTYDGTLDTWSSAQIATRNGLQLSSFATDEEGEVYLTDYGGTIYKLVESTPSGVTFPNKLSDTGCFGPADPRIPVDALIPYEPRSKLWSDDLAKRRWFAIPDGTTIDTAADGDFDFPIGSVLVKEFWHQGKRIETRLFVRHDDGGWGGYDYVWASDESDAYLVNDGANLVLDGGLAWRIPSQAQCFECHTSAAGDTLGLELPQLNVPMSYDGIWANQIATLDALGMFTNSPGAPASLPALARLDGPGSDEARSRSYLHANCSSCHRPGGTGLGGMDMLWYTAFANTNLCNVTPSGSTLGIANARRIAPGAPTRSLVYRRTETGTADIRMPPLGTTVAHGEAVDVLYDWIDGLTGCP